MCAPGTRADTRVRPYKNTSLTATWYEGVVRPPDRGPGVSRGHSVTQVSEHVLPRMQFSNRTLPGLRGI